MLIGISIGAIILIGYLALVSMVEYQKKSLNEMKTLMLLIGTIEHSINVIASSILEGKMDNAKHHMTIIRNRIGNYRPETSIAISHHESLRQIDIYLQVAIFQMKQKKYVDAKMHIDHVNVIFFELKQLVLLYVQDGNSGNSL